VLGYAVQLWVQRLLTPWYLPASATLAVVCLLVSLWQTRTAWRALALVLVVLFAGATWAFLLVARLPAYTGPITVGQPFPAFTTTPPDGAVFTQRNLEGDPDKVLVFFRGRW
jgi:cytochrome oxidase Cu insertion factor (SCO1/SenC/PrrC family)